MSKITISNLHRNSSALLSDSENYIRELSEEEMNIKSGFLPALVGLAVLLYATNAY
ncbi:hypothetical protein H6G97_24645 [Nostoc flagelliforme FACHB-838]|uniref:Uncharacterized protein n=1 Tax=Nostoc flagelliforme FACHB-838 TaxID=2692904 RepID=A0ABR8DUN4_9NOSO|nr:hypothetical protein [Nostoc flagelliforme]MBD2532601.1 hypothetical protein [Nostoc flagelliforme FACHB-838]